MNSVPPAWFSKTVSESQYLWPLCFKQICLGKYIFHLWSAWQICSPLFLAVEGRNVLQSYYAHFPGFHSYSVGVCWQTHPLFKIRFMCCFVCMYMHHLHVFFDARKHWKRASDPLELGLQVVIRYWELNSGPLWKTVSAFNSHAISPALFPC